MAQGPAKGPQRQPSVEKALGLTSAHRHDDRAESEYRGYRAEQPERECRTNRLATNRIATNGIATNRMATNRLAPSRRHVDAHGAQAFTPWADIERFSKRSSELLSECPGPDEWVVDRVSDPTPPPGLLRIAGQSRPRCSGQVGAWSNVSKPTISPLLATP